MSTPAFIRRLSSPIGIAVVLWLVAVVIIEYGLFSMGGAIVGNGPDVNVSIGLDGFPLMLVYRHNNLHAMQLQWGAIVLLIVPPVVGIGVAIYRLARQRNQWRAAKS